MMPGRAVLSPSLSTEVLTVSRLSESCGPSSTSCRQALRIGSAVSELRGARLTYSRTGGAPVRRLVGTSTTSQSGRGGKEKGKKPVRIILVRHGQSEGNIDETVYMRKPDNQISLTQQGRLQAIEAGRRIEDIVGDDMLYFYVSPYRRAQETLYYLGRDIAPERVLGVREDARLREQDFGNFQDEQMGSLKAARLRFSRFFFRFRDGESAADVYDRLTTFRETLRNDINFGRFGYVNDPRATTVVIVSHGLTLRVFLMRWFKWTVEMFEQVRNMDNAGILVLERGEGGRYSLTKYHSERELAEIGFTKEMIDDQNWALSACANDLNMDWPTSGPAFFHHFGEKLEAEAQCAAELGSPDVEVDANMHCHLMEPRSRPPLKTMLNGIEVVDFSTGVNRYPE